MRVPLPRLNEEVAQGTLCLKADDFTRCRFAVEIDGEPVGCFSVRSLGPHQLRLERAWNKNAGMSDPRTGLWVAGLVSRKFLRLREKSKVKITEFLGLGFRPRDVVVVVASKTEFFDGPDVVEKSTGELLKFECVDLLGVMCHGC